MWTKRAVGAAVMLFFCTFAAKPAIGENFEGYVVSVVSNPESSRYLWEAVLRKRDGTYSVLVQERNYPWYDDAWSEFLGQTMLAVASNGTRYVQFLSIERVWSRPNTYRIAWGSQIDVSSFGGLAVTGDVSGTLYRIRMGLSLSATYAGHLEVRLCSGSMARVFLLVSSEDGVSSARLMPHQLVRIAGILGGPWRTIEMLGLQRGSTAPGANPMSDYELIGTSSVRGSP
ncbi:MAG: hypothetical protein HY720_08245 [Planctomycetes bacterium]|nr:hypothetical protein [Planctomycetota bacterium]